MAKELIIWSEGYSVGINEIDNQHKKLIGLINKLYRVYLDKNTDELSGIIDEIKDYTLYHFSTEEKYFRLNKYPAEKEHIALHEEFITEFNQLIIEFKKTPTVLILKITTFLQRWLTKHILKEDKKYLTYLK